MVWFWRSDAEGVEDDGHLVMMTPIEQGHLIADNASFSKRKSPYLDLNALPPKRVKLEDPYVTTPPDTPAPSHDDSFESSIPLDLPSTMSSSRLPPITDEEAVLDEAASDTIQYHFGLEILLKHDELRLINQELAKCQVALEQLRRCHLIPYPTTCPTPEQMLNISSGTGAAACANPKQGAPQWAPPFGVVDGPYARHYAKWLIPDQSFGDAVLSAAQHGGAVKSTAEGRTTRTQVAENAGVGKRSGRAGAGQKLQALSAGYPQPKDKTGPCTLKNAAGEMVKLVCIDCHRENFSSTQGFINHCRIAHRRDLKSHEEAARQCGQSLTTPCEQAGPHSQPYLGVVSRPSGLVHPLAQYGPFNEKDACTSLLSRIKEARKLYQQGRLPGVPTILGPTHQRSSSPQQAFVASPDAPYLSQLMQQRHVGGDVREQVAEAKIRVDLSMMDSTLDDSVEEDTSHATLHTDTTMDTTLNTSRLASGMRMPAAAPTHTTPTTKPTLPLSSTPLARPAPENRIHQLDGFEDEDMSQIGLSPHAASSYHAPSLVSDDGEYGDSDDGASSTGDGSDVGSMSDLAHVQIEEDHEIDSRALGHRASTSSAGGQVKTADSDSHVAFLNNSIVNNPNNRRKL